MPRFYRQRATEDVSRLAPVADERSARPQQWRLGELADCDNLRKNKSVEARLDAGT